MDLTTYSTLPQSLQELHFSSFIDYLDSPIWEDVREKVKIKKGSNCFCCGAFAQTHYHERYDVEDLLGNCIRFIHPVCQDCYDDISMIGPDHCNFIQGNIRYRKKRINFLIEKNRKNGGVLVTQEILDAGRGIRGMWSRAQLAVFNVRSFKVSLKSVVLGRIYPAEQIKRFLEIPHEKPKPTKKKKRKGGVLSRATKQSGWVYR